MKMPSNELQKFTATQEAFLGSHGYTLHDITTSAQAHRIMHASGAYMALEPKMPGGYPDYTDAHIETALKRVYPHIAF